jgi:hypothetical protein
MMLGQNVGNTSAKRLIVQDIYILTEAKELCDMPRKGIGTLFLGVCVGLHIPGNMPPRK